MADALKDLYTPLLIEQVGRAIHRYHSEFDPLVFSKQVQNKHWPDMPLKSRMYHIVDMLKPNLPKDFNQASNILVSACQHFNGFEYMFFPGYFEKFGLNNLQTSLNALEKMTEFASAEFAIRPFIIQAPTETLARMQIWSLDTNEHLRRLASEGCRPRLPWAQALPSIKNDPSPILKILQSLKDDPSSYVQKSVANNLNDISKDHPNLTLDICRQWQGSSDASNWIIKHACRTLLKQSHAETLVLFGFEKPEHLSIADLKQDQAVAANGDFNFEFDIVSAKKQIGSLRIEYGIHFLRQNGNHNEKRFKIAEANYDEASKRIKKSYSFKPISTRRYYAGLQEFSLYLNGIEKYRGQFILQHSPTLLTK